MLLLLLACMNADADGDGFTTADDCDDTNASRNPDAEEICDGVDNNCNGLVDEGGGEVLLDLDGDGYGGSITLDACTSGPATATQGGDCNDGNPAAFPGAPELCNAYDDDCDGAIDEEPTDASLWYVDADGDGWGDEFETRVGCLGDNGLVAVFGDCDDGDPDVHPGADERCDDADNDCNGKVDDDAVDGTTWYADLDLDGYGGVITTVACEAPSEHWLDDGGLDCNDGDPLTNPDALERCDDVDNDCDGDIDEDDAFDATTWYADADEDGFGDEESPQNACEVPDGYVADATDCDDDEETTNPDAEEVCRDEVDNNCDDSANDCIVGDSETDDADYWFYGDSNDYLGRGLAVLDHDGDGVDDIAMGAPYGSSSYRGAVYMAYGATTLSDGDATSLANYYGHQSYQYAGQAVGNAGDVNGDGVDDLIIGGHSGSSTRYGRVWLVLGGSQASGDNALSSQYTWYTNSYSYLGYSVGSAGDLDGDGYDDVLMGGYYYSNYGYGRVWLMYGDSSITDGSLDSGYATFTGTSSYTYVGYTNSLSGVGDINGDGYDDAAIGCYRCEDYDDEGAVGLLHGSTTQWSGNTSFPNGLDAWIYGTGSNDYVSVVDDVGDVDGDGYDDLALGGWGAQSQRGELYLFYGSTTSLAGELDTDDADAEFRGDELSDYLGYSFAGADLDDDGANEIVVGARYNDEGSSNGGAIYILPGGSYSGSAKVADEASALLQGSDPNIYLGTQVATGDVDGDGYIDVIGSGDYAQNQNGSWGSGGTWVWLGTGM